MDRRLNVLIVSGFAFNDEGSGVNTMIQTLARCLEGSCRGVSLENDWNSPRLSKTDNTYRTSYALRLRSPYAAEAPVRGFIGWCLGFPMLMLDLRRLLRAERIDLIHLHYGAPYQYLFRLIRMLFGTPYVLTLHRGDIMTYPNLSPLDKMFARYAFNGANRVIAVSQWLAEQSLAAVGEMANLEVIHNGLDIGALEAIDDPDLESTLGFKIPEQYFLIVSNVAQYKAQDVAIRSWARVRQRWPNVPLLIVGDRRELWGECLRLVNELDCGDVVKFLGPQPRATAIGLMRRATAVLIPSRSEGLPYVLLEAGALGKPVICSNIGPFMEVVRDGMTALITPVEDHEAIADACIRLLNDGDLRLTLGNNLLHRIKSDFSAHQMAERYLSLYVDTCRTRTPS
jgi:glycosyltransferase involved in cell wall biosynthesis